VVRHPRARRARLTLDPITGAARLTLPKRAALGPAMEWARGQGAWLDAQRAMLPPAAPFAPGLAMTVADTALVLDWREGRRRSAAVEDGRLVFEGPAETLARRVEAWLRARALAVLSEDTAFYANRAGVSVARVGVGDPRGRWGSCASSGAIRYSWRLVLAPGWVRRATAAHEVAHRVHMNHGPAFHALAAELLGCDPAPARAWLRANGAGLQRLGRSG